MMANYKNLLVLLLLSVFVVDIVVSTCGEQCDIDAHCRGDCGICDQGTCKLGQPQPPCAQGLTPCYVFGPDPVFCYNATNGEQCCQQGHGVRIISLQRSTVKKVTRVALIIIFLQRVLLPRIIAVLMQLMLTLVQLAGCCGNYIPKCYDGSTHQCCLSPYEDQFICGKEEICDYDWDNYALLCSPKPTEAPTAAPTSAPTSPTKTPTTVSPTAAPIYSPGIISVGGLALTIKPFANGYWKLTLRRIEDHMLKVGLSVLMGTFQTNNILMHFWM